MHTNFKIAIAFLILGAPDVFAQAKQTITGTVTDAMCGAHHMMKNATPAQCTRECVKQGSDFALASGSKVYTLKGDKVQFDKYAGQTVKIKGTIAGSDLTVDSIAPSK
jgi:N-acetylglucosamine-6-phosphate deacetylase